MRGREERRRGGEEVRGREERRKHKGSLRQIWYAGMLHVKSDVFCDSNKHTPTLDSTFNRSSVVHENS